MLNSLNGSTIAGQSNGVTGSTSKYFHYPTDVIIDSIGNFHITDRYNNRVQLWAPGSSEGKTIAGTGKNRNSKENILKSNQLNFPCINCIF